MDIQQLSKKCKVTNLYNYLRPPDGLPRPDDHSDVLVISTSLARPGTAPDSQYLYKTADRQTDRPGDEDVVGGFLVTEPHGQLDNVLRRGEDLSGVLPVQEPDPGWGGVLLLRHDEQVVLQESQTGGLDREVVGLVVEVEVKVIDAGEPTEGIEGQPHVGGRGEVHHVQRHLHGSRGEDLRHSQ